ncbi:MAG: acylphosphatase [Candidatus Diapherotrites archaeon]|nr:acylphosphatase [Candidatus Diapherotrites archaeon]
MMKRIEAKVYGIVQGVGFRYFVQRIANNLNLKGFVRNLADGSVEVVAEGSKEKLEELLKEIRVGPPLSRVDSVEVEWKEPLNEFSKFEIRH